MPYTKIIVKKKMVMCIGFLYTGDKLCNIFEKIYYMKDYTKFFNS